jgi:hypothetical protein
MNRILRTLLSLPACIAPTTAQDSPAPPTPQKELGTVVWQRDFEAALADAKQQQKPLFLLFQEVPGCETCTGFGQNVLSHPLLKDAIEQCFVPVVVRNNVEGAEGKIRERFEEPAWNNPVVRFLDQSGKDLLPRQDLLFDAHRIAARMIASLTKANRPVPGYLQVAFHESAPNTATAVFQMHCFWEGEAVLGSLDGVVTTKSAFANGAEVVEVTFRPEVLTKLELSDRATAKSCKPVVAESLKVADPSDQQHALLGTIYAKLELTPMQRTKVHAALTLGSEPRVWLSPTQLRQMEQLEQGPAPR